MSQDPTDLRSVQEAEAGRKAKAQQQAKSEEDELAWLMGQKRGRSFIWKLLEKARVFHPSYNATAMQMAFNEGRKDYGMQMLREILDSCPDEFLKMQREAIAAQKTEV